MHFRWGEHDRTTQKAIHSLSFILKRYMTRWFQILVVSSLILSNLAVFVSPASAHDPAQPDSMFPEAFNVPNGGGLFHDVTQLLRENANPVYIPPTFSHPEARMGSRAAELIVNTTPGGFEVSSSSTLIRNVVAAYDSINQRFLYIWSEPNDPDCVEGPWCYDHVVAQLVSTDGAPIGSQITLIDTWPMPDDFHLAYSPTSQTYLFGLNYRDITANPRFQTMVLNSSGMVVGNASMTEQAYLVDLVYMDQEDAFAIAYMQEHDLYDDQWYIRRIGSDGSYGPLYWTYTVTDLAYNHDTNELLYTRSEETQMAVARLNAATMTSIGTSITIPGSSSTAGDIFYTMNQIAYNGISGEYLAVWGERTTTVPPGSLYHDSFRLYGQRLESDGNPVSGTSPVELALTEDAYQELELVASRTTDEYLLLWKGSGLLLDGELEPVGGVFPFMTLHDDGYCDETEISSCSGRPRAIPLFDQDDPFLLSWVEYDSFAYSIRGVPFTQPGVVDAEEVFSACGDQSDPLDCVISNYAAATGVRGDPINTLTGSLDYPIIDLSIPTVAGPLLFQRSYASGAVDRYTDVLGFGWTHNHDTRLIFPSDPDGREGVVLYKSHSANIFEFFDNGDGTFDPEPGLILSLVRNPGSPVTYTLTDYTQNTYLFNEGGDLLSLTNPEGYIWTYSYDGDDRLSMVTDDTSGRYISISYDPQGRISNVHDNAGRSVQFSYNANGDLSNLVDVLGQTWTYQYDSAHHLTRVLDPDEMPVIYTEYDADGRAFRQRDADFNILIEITYNSDGSATIVDALGNTSTDTYNSRNTRTHIADALGNTAERSYDANFRPTSLTDTEGNTTQLAWSTDGANLTQVVDAEGNQSDLSYDALNNLTDIVDPEGYLTSFTYDGTLLTSTTDALGNTTTYAYTAEGYLASVTDARGNTTSYGFDAYGQRTSMTDALGNTWSYAYDDVGRLTDTTDPLGQVTHNDYDPAGRIIRSTRNYDPARIQNEDGEYNIVTEYVYDSVGNMVETIDTYGRSTQYVYDNDNRLVETIDPTGHSTTSAYDDAGNLTSSTDALGNTTTYAYDELNRLVATTDPLGNTTTTAYNPDSTVASTTDALGHATSFTYDDLNRVVATTDALGNATSTVYDASGNVSSTTDAAGNMTCYAYDALGRVIRQTDAEGGETEFFYDEVGNRVQTIDPNGNATTYTYDALNRVATITDALGHTTSFAYDAVGNQTSVTDANGHTTTYGYDSLYRQVAVTDPLGNTSTTAFDALGNVVEALDANGNITFYTYDELNHLVSLEQEGVGITSYTYDDAGNQRTVTDDNGHTTTTSYDALNRPITVTDPLGHTTMTAYNTVGSVTAVTDPLGNATTFAYDAVGRQTAVTDPLGNSTHYAYDAVGNRSSMTDANGVVTRYEYDDLSRLTAVVENDVDGSPADHETNVRTEYGYDANSNRTAIEDANGHVTQFAYDAANRLISETDPLGHTTAYGYDPVGNRTTLVDAEGFTTSFQFDAADRLTTIDYPSPDADVHFAYDAVGNRISMTDGMGTTTWSYDDGNRPEQVTDPFGGVVSYAYDGVGNRESIQYPDGQFVSYAYDAADRLIEVADWDSQVTAYVYDAANQLITTALPNGVTTSRAYDSAGQVLHIEHATASETLSSFAYVYDPVGNRTRAEEYYLTPGGGPTVTIMVAAEDGGPMADIPVYAFDGETYTGYHETTDENGEASITLPEGDYRFRVDVDGTQFWSDESDHCAIPGCTNILLTIPDPVLVVVQDTGGVPAEGLPVYVFDGETYTGVQGTTDAFGETTLRLVEGDYRFRADKDATQFWSGEANHCPVPGCTLANITVSVPVTVTVLDSLGMPQEGLPVYAFSGGSYTGYHGTSDAEGEVSLTLPLGEYRFRADSGGTQFWSGEMDHCTVPGCLDAAITVSVPLTVTVEDTDGTPMEGLPVYVFDGETYTGFNATTDENGVVEFTLSEGTYRFRSDLNGTQFWSGEPNHCAVPGCESAEVVVTIPLTVLVKDAGEQPLEGVPVYAFDEATYTGYNGTTGATGEVELTLPQGSYRFRADVDGEQYWSGEENHCTVPGCEAAEIIAGTSTPTETPEPSPTATETPDPSPTPTDQPAPTPSETPIPTDTPEPTPTESPAPTATEVAARPGMGVLAAIRPAPLARPFLEEGDVVVTVLDTDASPQEGLPVYAFDGETYTGVHGTTDPLGQATLNLPDGDYRFRSDLNGTQFWSGEANHCTVPGCTEAGITVSIPVTITVEDTDGIQQEGLPVYAFSGGAYSGYHGTTDAAGEVSLTMPLGDYRFRADKDGTQFWSGESDHCTVPGCLGASVVVTVPLTVTVENTDGDPQEGLPVYAFDGETYTGYHGSTDADGEVNLTLPEGSYRFRSDLNGTQFWSGEANHCDVPGCLEADVVVTIPLTVTVQSQTGVPYADLPVYAFSNEDYSGDHGTTDENGEVVFTVPEGSYRFRSDYDGVQFWSGETDHCAVPGCLEALVEIPGGSGEEYVVIDYEYDPLYRLTAADYDSGAYFHYQYDAVGNRLEQETHEGTSTYAYDAANRLIDVDGVAYAWSANGNLLSDGVSTYSYDHANRLMGVVQGSHSYLYAYNGLGDRLAQSVNGVYTNYTLDIVSPLTQVLADGENATLYGLARLGEEQADGWQMHLGDALGSVRQLADAASAVTMAQAYAPFGDVLSTSGDAETVFQYTGEQVDPTGLVYLRARYYAPASGRFLTMDAWEGDPYQPLSYNPWLYVTANPVNLVDPSGRHHIDYQTDQERELLEFIEQRTDYTLEPPFIQWSPALSVKRPDQVPRMQYYPSVLDPSTGEYEEMEERDWGVDLCGHICLEIIIENVTGLSYQLTPVYEILGKGKTFAEDLARAILGVVPDPDRWQVWNHGYTSSTRYELQGGREDDVETIVSNPNWYGNDAQLPSRLRDMLSRGHYVVPLVFIDTLRAGALVPHTQSDTGHWVLLTGISSQFRTGNMNSEWNWVRIYNPFLVRPEYYTWNEFYHSLSGSRRMLEVWRGYSWN